MELRIKNMVCPRCIESVRKSFESHRIEVHSIELGRVDLKEVPNLLVLEELSKELVSNGFEILEDQKSKIISQIKSLLVHQIHHSKDNIKINFSTFLAYHINQDYTSLSRLFSSVEGITIEKFILAQKIEKVKELLCYSESSLSEIAFEMGYSSTAHLSSQFKKETGMTPTQFKNINASGEGNHTQTRRSLDAI